MMASRLLNFSDFSMWRTPSTRSKVSTDDGSSAIRIRRGAIPADHPLTFSKEFALFQACASLALFICRVAAPDVAAAQIDASARQTLCEAWTKSGDFNDPSTQDDHAMMVQWTFGFLTATAILNSRISAGVSHANDDGIVRWIDGYCLAHPLDTIQRAADAFALELLDNSK